MISECSRPVAPMVAGRSIAAIAFDEANSLDLFGVLHPLGRTTHDVAAKSRLVAQPNSYVISVVSPWGDTARLTGGVIVATERVDPGQAIDTLIIPGGLGLAAWVQSPGVMQWLGQLCANARRICALGDGVLALASTGRLEGRRAATRSDLSEQLETLFPNITIARDAVFVRDGELWTGAGDAAALDVALALIEADFGRAVAMQMARRMAVYAKRSPSQPQISALLEAQSVGSDVFDRLHAWISDNLHGDLRIERLAERAGMSPRSFTRRYTETVGAPPAGMIERIRIEAARQAIECGESDLSSIARRFGFSSADTLRRVFVRYVGESPKDHRTARVA